MSGVPYDYSPAAERAWLEDAATNALLAWIWSWRRRPEAIDGEPRPGEAFTRHIGRDAVMMMHEDASRVEMSRIFSEAAYRGTCPCGQTPDDLVTEQAAQIVDERERRALTLARSGGNVRA